MTEGTTKICAGVRSGKLAESCTDYWLDTDFDLNHILNEGSQSPPRPRIFAKIIYMIISELNLYTNSVRSSVIFLALRLLQQ